MGRPRGFDEAEVLRAAIALFGRRGYDGLPVDVLTADLGLSRASLYKIYGSKHGLLRAALHDVVDRGATDDAARDLVLVALLELAPVDEGVRALAGDAVERCFGGDPAALGGRLIARSGLGSD